MPVWQKLMLQLVLKFVSQYLTPERIDEGKAKFIDFLRRLAKEQSPDFPFDDELVELLAKALGVAK